MAVHCVSRQSLVLAAVALAQAGGGPHRIEHASSPPEVVDQLASLPVTVVTQPGFVGEHGDRYRREVEAPATGRGSIASGAGSEPGCRWPGARTPRSGTPIPGGPCGRR